MHIIVMIIKTLRNIMNHIVIELAIVTSFKHNIVWVDQRLKPYKLGNYIMDVADMCMFIL